jgi:peptide/nickel transport system ATP-binding protein
MQSNRELSPGPLLEIKDLTIAYQSGDQWLEVVREVSLQLIHGQTYGIVGESGSGKTSLALGILGYLPKSGSVCQGSIVFEDQNLLEVDGREMRKILGSRLAFVPQDPLASLNPSLTIGEQLVEGLKAHSALSRKDARHQTLEWLELVRIPDPIRVYESYPHQISGGMQQRVMIALALSMNPHLLVLDEPTTNIDVTSQAVILDLLKYLIHDRGTAVIYITHNLGVVSQICDRVAVLYAGELLEDGPTSKLYQTPLHPYTRELLSCVPRLGENKRHSRLHTIQGSIPHPSLRPSGCVFRPRCQIAIEICEEPPPLFAAAGDHRSRCHRWKEIADHTLDPSQEIPIFNHLKNSSFTKQPILRLEDVKVRFEPTHPIRAQWRGKTAKKIQAVNGISLQVSQGQTLGLVGESGSGKTTLARAIIGLIKEAEGQYIFRDAPLPKTLQQRDLSILREIQMVFQNPEEALNPYLTIGKSLQRPLQTMMGMGSTEAEKKVGDLLALVQLPSEYASRRPSQLSGGELQRVAILRAFSSMPKLLLTDEPTSALDVSVQASILNLLAQIQIENNTAILLISHDIAAVGYLADRIAVIYRGKLMEIADAEDLFTTPHHPYSEALLSAIPSLERETPHTPIRLEGEVPSLIDVLSGCPFHSRCPRMIGEICRVEAPPWQITSSGKQIFCHISPDELHQIQSHETYRNTSKEID